MSSTISVSHLPAALSVPSRAFTYRFFLSSCFLLLVLCSLALGHTVMGVFILALLDLLFCGDILLRCGIKDIWNGQFSLSALVSVCALCG
ncbi:MAG: hypothetical protein J6Q05_02940, partial [Elusimicrobiaceae bacterium]|nr:hypothetical protein [Elusimicrobiaceae bacterium]